MLNLDTIKSAVPIEDQGEIHKALSERKHTSPQTSISRTKNGETKVMKVAKDAAPVVLDILHGELKALVAARGMAWDDAYVGRTVDYWASDERVDSHGDILRQNFVFDEFEGNSPMPLSHDWGGLPVGRALQWEVRQRSSPGYQGDALWLRGLFATAEQYELADSVFRLVKGGIFPAGSVGVWPERLIRVEDPKERGALGMPDYGLILDKNHLLEFSPTLLGANSGALAIYSQAKSRGFLKAEDFLVIREVQRQQLERGGGDVATWRELEEDLRILQRYMFPRSEFQKHAALDEPIVPTGEERALRGSVAAPELKTLEDRIEQISMTLDTTLPSLMRVMEDVRETVEGLKERPSQGVSKEPAGVLSEKTIGRAESLLAKLASINT